MNTWRRGGLRRHNIRSDLHKLRPAFEDRKEIVGFTMAELQHIQKAQQEWQELAPLLDPNTWARDRAIVEEWLRMTRWLIEAGLGETERASTADLLERARVTSVDQLRERWDGVAHA